MSMLPRKRACCSGVSASNGEREKLNALGMNWAMDAIA
jgi:hypothetical protein